MYADDFVLLSPSVCDLRKMIDILCVDKASRLNLKFNAKKNCVLRFAARYLHYRKQITLDGMVIEYASTAIYLGVLLHTVKSHQNQNQNENQNALSRYSIALQPDSESKSDQPRVGRLYIVVGETCTSRRSDHFK